jgi:hypothetical protein
MEYDRNHSSKERKINVTTNQDLTSTTEDQTPLVSPGNYSPVTVTVKDTLGTIFLGILAGILLVGWMRAEARYQTLITRLEETNGSHSLNAR